MGIKDYVNRKNAEVPDLPAVNIENRRGKNLIGKGGSKRKLTQKEWSDMILMYNDGWSVTALAEKFEVSRGTVYNYLRTAAQAQLQPAMCNNN